MNLSVIRLKKAALIAVTVAGSVAMGILFLCSSAVAFQSTQPTIAVINPSFGMPGTTFDATVGGINLAGVLSVTFGGGGITATLRSGGTVNTLPISISIASDAAIGARFLNISTGAGTASCICFTVVPRSWTLTAPMNVGRVLHAATLLSDGKVLVTGGQTRLGFTPTSELYDPGTGTWALTNPMHTPRDQHTATMLSNGQVLVVGGLDNTQSPLASAELYDPSTQSWAAVNSMSVRRYAHSATRLTDGRVLVIGGADASFGEIYDPSTGIWTPTFEMEVSVRSNVATLLPNGKVLIVSSAASDPALAAQLFDPTTLQIRRTGAMHYSFAALTAVLLSDGRVMVIGPEVTRLIARMELYDPRTGSWTIGPAPILGIQAGVSATLLPNAKILVAGNRDTEITSTFDPVNSTWALTGPMVTPTTSHAAVLLGNGTVLVAGGESVNGFQSRAEIYDPNVGSSVVNPSPILTSITPTTGTQGSGDTALTIAGKNFIQGSTVQIGMVPIATTFVNSTTLTAVMPAANLVSPGILNISVTNPPPGGGNSGAVTFSVVASTTTNPTTNPQPIPEVETGNIQTGYIIVTPDLGTGTPTTVVSYGSVQNGSVQSKAGVLAPPLTTSATAAVEFVGNINRNLGLAIVNPNNAANAVTLTLKDKNGAIVGIPVTLTMDPYKQVARFVSELFPADVIGASFIGSINLQSTLPFAPLGLTFTGATFSTIALGATPVTTPLPTRSLSAGAALDTPKTGTVGGIGAVIFRNSPMAADGRLRSGW